MKKYYLKMLLWLIFFIVTMFVVVLSASEAVGEDVNHGEIGQIYIFKVEYQDGEEKYFVVERKKEYHWLRYLNIKEKEKLPIILEKNWLKKWIWIDKIGEQK